MHKKKKQKIKNEQTKIGEKYKNNKKKQRELKKIARLVKIIIW